MEKNIFKDYLKELNVEINEKMYEQLEQYFEILVEENKKYNLTGITDYKEVFIKHFYDSLTICSVIDLNSVTSLADVGSGAGFPGLVLKIMFPNLKVYLIESSMKRCNFLNLVSNTLNLKNIEVLNKRAEEVTTELYDVTTARAVSKLSILAELCVPMLKTNGYFIPLKGSNLDEINNTKFETILNLNLVEHKTIELPFNYGSRNILKYKKTTLCDKKYPRSYNEILKKPL